MMEQVKEVCNCYEGMDQMINEGGCVGSIIYSEEWHEIENPHLEK